MPADENAPPPDPSVTDARAWPPDTSVSEVAKFASDAFGTHLLLWVARMREKQYAEAYRECQNLRRVVMRMEAYQRMLLRRGLEREKKPNETDSRS